MASMWSSVGMFTPKSFEKMRYDMLCWLEGSIDWPGFVLVHYILHFFRLFDAAQCGV